jgi:hypothetical protein
MSRAKMTIPADNAAQMTMRNASRDLDIGFEPKKHGTSHLFFGQRRPNCDRGRRKCGGWDLVQPLSELDLGDTKRCLGAVR